MSALFEAVDVTKTFGGLTALQRVGFAVDGGIASIIGPNGAGKTTLFNVFTGLYRPDGGTVRFRGEPLVGLRPDEITARGVCRTFQNIRLFANMTAAENVLVGMHARIRLGLRDVLTRGPRFVETERELWQRAAAPPPAAPGRSHAAAGGPGRVLRRDPRPARCGPRGARRRDRDAARQQRRR